MAFTAVAAIVLVLLLVFAWAGLRGLFEGDLPPERTDRTSGAPRVAARVVAGVVALALLALVLAVGWVTSVD